MFNKYGKTPDKVFDQFDKNPKNYLLSPPEMAAMVKRYLGLNDDLLESEILMIKELFKTTLMRTEIQKAELNDFI